MAKDQDTCTEFDALISAQSKHISSLKAALNEERRLNHELQDRCHKLTSVIATGNTHLRMMFNSMKDMACEQSKVGPETVPIREEDIPTAKSFIKGLADKIAAAGNGQ